MHRPLLLSLLVLLSRGASPRVTPRMRLLRTEALLSRILDQVQDPGEMDISPGDGSIDRGVEEDSVFAKTLVATPSNANTSCMNDTSCSLYQFELNPKSNHSLSSVHMWLQKTDAWVDMSVCWATSAERDRWMCEHLTNISEVKSVMDWGIYDLTTTLASDYTNSRLFCTVQIFGLSSEEHDQKPFLVVTTNSSVAKRRKRRSTISPTSNCHLVDFHISFQQIGWWWVVAPKGFNARMCSGRCSNQVNSFPSPHHQVLSTILNRNRSSGAREEEWSPCCSATKLTPLDMIYVVANTTASTNVTTASLVYRKIENMVTDSCGCW